MLQVLNFEIDFPIIFLQALDNQPAPEPTDDINTYMDVLDCLVEKIKNGLHKIGLGNNFEETLKQVEKSRVCVVAKAMELKTNKQSSG